MKHRPLKQLCGLIATAAIALVLIGCNGKAGQNGTNGTNGANGANGSNGSNGTDGTNGANGVVTINAAAVTPEEWADLHLTGSVQSVAVSAAAGKPVVKFTVTDQYGTPVSGLSRLTTQTSSALVPSYANVSLTIAKLVPGTNGSPSFWANYIVTSMPTKTTAATPAKPSTDNTGTLAEPTVPDGTYTYTFYRDITAAQAFLDAYASYTTTNLRADLGDVTFDGTLTHRVAVQIGGNARGTSTNTADGSNTSIPGVAMSNPANIYYDFIPSTGKAVAATDLQRVIVDTASCNRCHSKLAVHGAGARQDIQYCVTCHTDQRKYGNNESVVTATTVAPPALPAGTTATYKIDGLATGNFVAFIHRMHMGEELSKTGYNYANILFNEVTYPQDQRNCTTCHTGTGAYAKPQGDNWKNVPSRLACGSCHDQVNFATGANHGTPANGGSQLDDKNCAGCHTAAAIATYHQPVTLPNSTAATLPASLGGVSTNTRTNASYLASDINNLPAGAHWFKWDIKSVSVNATRQPVWVFRFLVDGDVTQPVLFNTFAAGVTEEMMTGYVGGPNLYLAYNVPQDGIAANDWNSTVSTNLRLLWRGAAAAGSTLTYDAATKYYTATLAGVTVPPTATMITGGIGYFYGVVPNGTTGVAATDKTPLVQINLANYPYGQFKQADGTLTPVPFYGGLAVANPNQWLKASGQADRRAIVTTAKCNECHKALGVFTNAVFHAGQRNDAPTCTFCHNADGVNAGWSYNIKDAVHAIHASGKRTYPFTWHNTATGGYWNVTYPAILNNCEACHVPGSYNFVNTASANAQANNQLLWSEDMAGTANAAGITLTDPKLFDGTKSYISPFVTAGTNYGQNFQVNTTTATKAATTWMGTTIPLAAGAAFEPEPTTLVSSPITAACMACHDSVTAKGHFTTNGGSVAVPRSTVVTAVAGINTVPIVKKEQCLLCHGDTKVADIRKVHMTWK